MATETPVNGVGTTLAAAITSTSTTLALTSATGFTNAQYHVLLTDGTNYEIALATALSGTSLTVTRAVESYGGVQTAFPFAATSSVTVVPSVASVQNLINQSTIPGTQVPNVVVIVAESATPAIDTDLGNVFSITGLAQAITSMTTGLTGTPVHGQFIWIEITDNGTAQAIAWGVKFANSSVALPNSTIANQVLRVLLTWNIVTSTWDYVDTLPSGGTMTGSLTVDGGLTAGNVNTSVVQASSGYFSTGAGVTTPTVTSGTAFTPANYRDATVYFQVNATVAGSYTLTMGPTTGAEHTIGSSVAMVVGSDDVVTLRVPGSWKVVITLTSVTLSSTTVVTM